MLKQRLSQKLSQKLSPQQIQLMKLIQLPTTALEERIQEELETNPALEEPSPERDDDDFDTGGEDDDSERIEADDINVDDYLSDDEIPDYRLRANNYSSDDEERQVPISGGQTFYGFLMEQIQMRRINEEEKQLAEYLIGSIDDDGYIRRELINIVDDLAFSQNIFTTEEELERILKVVQKLEPAGVGARNLQECLILQLERKPKSPNTSMALEVLEEYFEAFTRKHYSKILDKLGIDEDMLRGVLEEITRLNPKPGNSIAGNTRVIGQAITPDYYIFERDGDIQFQINARNAPELSISREYREMLEQYKAQKEHSRKDKEAVMFVKQKIDSAKWFVDAIRQRQQTLLLVMGAIVEKQNAYFLSGDERDLKPMILKDIAEMTDLDISTVSRVASNKYAQTPYGTFLLKVLFSESMTNDQGEEVSTREIKKILEELIQEESKKKPLTDEKLAALLKEKGYPIARRTVAKYREQLGVPTARLRKEI